MPRAEAESGPKIKKDRERQVEHHIHRTQLSRLLRISECVFLSVGLD